MDACENYPRRFASVPTEILQILYCKYGVYVNFAVGAVINYWKIIIYTDLKWSQAEIDSKGNNSCIVEKISGNNFKCDHKPGVNVAFWAPLKVNTFHRSICLF